MTKQKFDLIDNRGSGYSQQLLSGADSIALAAMGIGYGPQYSYTEVRKLLQRAWGDGYRTAVKETVQPQKPFVNLSKIW